MIGLRTGISYITNIGAFGLEVCDMAVANDYQLVNIIVQLPNSAMHADVKSCKILSLYT